MDSSNNGFGSFSAPTAAAIDRKKLPNMDLIASINANLAKKTGGVEFSMPVMPQVQSKGSGPSSLNGDDSNDGSGERKRKRKSRWGTEDPTEKTFIPGLPTMLPPNLTKEQEEAYLRKFQFFISDLTFLSHFGLGKWPLCNDL